MCKIRDAAVHQEMLLCFLTVVLNSQRQPVVLVFSAGISVVPPVEPVHLCSPSPLKYLYLRLYWLSVVCA